MVPVIFLVQYRHFPFFGQGAGIRSPLSLLSNLKVLGINLKSGIISTGIAASHFRGATPYAGIQNVFAWICVSLDQVLKQRYRLLRRMQPPFTLNLQDLPRIMDNTGLRVL